MSTLLEIIKTVVFKIRCIIVKRHHNAFIKRVNTIILKPYKMQIMECKHIFDRAGWWLKLVSNDKKFVFGDVEAPYSCKYIKSHFKELKQIIDDALMQDGVLGLKDSRNWVRNYYQYKLKGE